MNTPPPPFREDTGSEKRSGQPRVTQPESDRGLTRVRPACPHHATWCRQQGAGPAPHVAKGRGHWPVRPGDRNVGLDTGEETRARAASVAARQLAAGPLRGNTCSGSEGGKLPPPQPPFIGGDTEAQEGASDQNPHADPRAGRRLPARWLSPRPSGDPSEERAKPALPGPARTWRRAALTGPFCSSLFVLDTDLHPGLRGGWRWNQGPLPQVPALRASSQVHAGPCPCTVTSCAFPGGSRAAEGLCRGTARRRQIVKNLRDPRAAPSGQSQGQKLSLCQNKHVAVRFAKELFIPKPAGARCPRLGTSKSVLWSVHQHAPSRNSSGDGGKDVTGYAVTGATRREQRGKGVPGKGPRSLQPSACSAAKRGHTCLLPLGDNGSYARGGSEDRTRGPTVPLPLSIQA